MMYTYVYVSLSRLEWMRIVSSCIFSRTGGPGGPRLWDSTGSAIITCMLVRATEWVGRNTHMGLPRPKSLGAHAWSPSTQKTAVAASMCADPCLSKRFRNCIALSSGLIINYKLAIFSQSGQVVCTHDFNYMSAIPDLERLESNRFLIYYGHRKS